MEENKHTPGLWFLQYFVLSILITQNKAIEVVLSYDLLNLSNQIN